MPTFEELREERLKKLALLKKQGIDPYPIISLPDRKTKKTASLPLARRGIKEILEGFETYEKNADWILIAGRIRAMRVHGKAAFLDLEDENGKMQLFANEEDTKDFALLKEAIDIGDILECKGNAYLSKRGEKSIRVREWRLLAKSISPLPSEWFGLKEKEERFRKRYLDLLMNEDVRKRFIIRSKIISEIRRFFDERGFLEVETPTLQPLYGGGFARPFITYHNELENNFYLRISDEMYLKRLIVGGFEKVYEITKVFRNEGVDFDHNPEFTMFEAQIAYKDYRYGMDIIEELFEDAALRTLGTTNIDFKDHSISVKRPWKRYKLVDAIETFTGIDPLKWKSADEARETILSCDINKFVSREIKKEKLTELEKIHTIGEMMTFLFEEKVEENLIQPTIIYDYPVEVSPLAKKCEDSRFTQRFEFFAFGSEIGNNYSELNDPLDLKQRFIDEKKKADAGFQEAHQTDYDYLQAIEYGFPPTCGLGIGVDRMVMLLSGAPSIKEVIFFPLMRPKWQNKEDEKSQ